MSNSLIGKLAQWGWADEGTSVGTETEPDFGVPVLNKAAIDFGQTWVEDAKQTGNTVLRTVEVISDTVSPTWKPQTTLLWTGAGAIFAQWLAHLTHNASEAFTTKYVQTVQPPLTAGKTVTFGESRTGNAVYSATVKQKLGQTGSRDIAAMGGVLDRVDVTIGNSGMVKVDWSWRFLDYTLADSAAGTFTLPATSGESKCREWVYKLGDSPAALYAEEMRFSLIADVVEKRYAGASAAAGGAALPYAFVYNGWSLEGSFTKPVVAGTDMLMKDFFIEGGETGIDQLLYVYTTGLTDYNETIGTTGTAGDMRWTFNIKFDSVELGFDNETVERVGFKGVYDGTNTIWKFENVTDATNAWATQS